MQHVLEYKIISAEPVFDDDPTVLTIRYMLEVTNNPASVIEVLVRHILPLRNLDEYIACNICGDLWAGHKVTTFGGSDYTLCDDQINTYKTYFTKRMSLKQRQQQGINDTYEVCYYQPSNKQTDSQPSESPANSPAMLSVYDFPASRPAVYEWGVANLQPNDQHADEVQQPASPNTVYLDTLVNGVS